MDVERERLMRRNHASSRRGSLCKNADNCEHLAGEWDSSLSEPEQRQIKRSVVKYCGTAQKQLKTLKSKYKSEATLQKILSVHEYDSVKSFVK